MKTFIFIIILLIVLVFLYSRKLSDDVSNFKYDVDFESLDLSGFNLQDFNTTGSKIKVKTKLIIQSNSNILIPFSNLNLSLLYKDKVVAMSDPNEPSNFGSIKVNQGTNFIYQYMDLFLNSESIDLIGKLKLKIGTEVNLNISLKWLGLPIKANIIQTI